MSDLICRKTMMRCQTPGMCAPHGGCSTGVLKEANVRYSNTSQTAEAEGVDEPIVIGWLGGNGMHAEREAASGAPFELMTVVQHQNILSAVTAERDRLREQCRIHDMLHGTKGRERVAALLAEIDQLRTEVGGLRKDADRFRHIERDCDSGMSRIYGDNWIAVIDEHIATEAAMAAKEE